MNKVEKYQQLENSQPSWAIAKRWARFGKMAAMQLSAKSSNRSDEEKELSNEIQSLASDLVEAMENNNYDVIQAVAKEWESPDLNKEGLVTCADTFDTDKEQLAAFHATQSGQMLAIGYANKDLPLLPIEIASTYRTHYVEGINEIIEELYALNFSATFETCFYNEIPSKRR